MSLGDAAIARLAEAMRSERPGHDRYEIGAVIGSGGMGTVHRAHDRLLEREVAIKIVREGGAGMAARLEQEARILGQLDHPGLIPVHDAGQLDDGRAFYVMRLVRGERLDHHLEAGAGLAERLRLFLKICEPIAFAHDRGVIHRDLKPANIMVGPFGEVVVLDWGIAKIGGGSEGVTVISTAPPGATGPGAVLGTIGFMAPEQGPAGSGQVDVRSDVYSLGAVLGQILEPLGEVPRPVRAIARRAMAMDPAGRYQAVGGLTADVTRFLDGAPVEAYRENVLERAGRFVSRHRTAIGLILAYLGMRLLLLWVG